MSIFQEFAEDVQRRQLRVVDAQPLAAQRFVKQRKDQRRDILVGVFLFLLFSTFLGAAICQKGCGGGNGEFRRVEPEPQAAPAALITAEAHE